jgi:hypothetical protein
LRSAASAPSISAVSSRSVVGSAVGVGRATAEAERSSSSAKPAVEAVAGWTARAFAAGCDGCDAPLVGQGEAEDAREVAESVAPGGAAVARRVRAGALALGCVGALGSTATSAIAFVVAFAFAPVARMTRAVVPPARGRAELALLAAVATEAERV